MPMLNYDPVEDTPEFKAIKDELEKKIVAKTGKNGGMGYCHLYWATKRDVLKKDYGIKWSSPVVQNPTPSVKTKISAMKKLSASPNGEAFLCLDKNIFSRAKNDKFGVI